MAAEAEGQLIAVRIPAAWTLAGLVGGLGLGWLLAESSVIEPLLAVAQPVGRLWLRALQMTIIPLVAALLVIGIAQIVAAARAGAVAQRTLGWIFAVLTFGGLVAVILMPLLLDAFPVPAGASGLLLANAGEQPVVPAVGDFIVSLVAPNVVAAAAETAMLPLTIFFSLFALALVRLPESQRETMLGFFYALANVMLQIIGWVLWVAPAGVFALAIGVAATGGGGAFATLGHYIVTVSAMGGVVLIAGYVIGAVAGRVGFVRFARAMLPAQAVGLSTQSSLASLPAMLVSARRMNVREATADFVLPLSVAIFRSTSPAMNLAVAIYIAHVAGVELTPLVLAAGLVVALIISVGSVSLPGSISFVISIGPIAYAMGVPVEPLALLVAVEMLPDIMRTVANVTLDVAVTAAVDRLDEESPAKAQP